jgi:hypothetical protein
MLYVCVCVCIWLCQCAFSYLYMFLHDVCRHFFTHQIVSQSWDSTCRDSTLFVCQGTFACQGIFLKTDSQRHLGRRAHALCAPPLLVICLSYRIASRNDATLHALHLLPEGKPKGYRYVSHQHRHMNTTMHSFYVLEMKKKLIVWEAAYRDKKKCTPKAGCSSQEKLQVDHLVGRARVSNKSDKKHNAPIHRLKGAQKRVLSLSAPHSGLVKGPAALKSKSKHKAGWGVGRTS